ncbi:hypothetical protein AAHE18_03G096800 [Arachis hypogaea]
MGLLIGTWWMHVARGFETVVEGGGERVIEVASRGEGIGGVKGEVGVLVVEVELVNGVVEVEHRG